MTEATAVGTATSAGLANGGTFSVEVDADDADELNIYVDDNAGGAPASHDVDLEVEIDGAGTYMQGENVASASTAGFHSSNAAPANDKVRVTITNQSGGAADFRATVIAADN